MSDTPESGSDAEPASAQPAGEPPPAPEAEKASAGPVEAIPAVSSQPAGAPELVDTRPKSITGPPRPPDDVTTRRPAGQAADRIRERFDAESTEGKQPSAPGAADDGDRGDYDPQEQREREYFQRNHSRAGRGAAASGSNSQANYYDFSESHVHYEGRQYTVHYGVFQASDVSFQKHTYVPVPEFGAMLSVLQHQRLVRLRGEPGSGRRTTAINLLVEAGCRIDRIGTVEVDSELIFSVLAEKGVMQDGDGLIIDRAGRPMKDGALEALRRLARGDGTGRGAHLVILDSATSDADESSVRHERPQLPEVLEKHFWSSLPTTGTLTTARRDADRDFLGEALRHPAVDRRLKLAQSVYYVVSLAVFLATTPDRDRLGQALATWDNQARTLAKKILGAAVEPDDRSVPDDKGAGNDKTHLIPHRQAFRIAYAVFDGHPLSDVFHAGELLSQEIMPLYETRGTQLDRLIPDGDVDQLIYPGMVAPAPGGDPQTGPRCAMLADESLITAILDVAWHDYDTLRGPLLTWLTVLAGNRSWRVRLRAAQIAGILADFDFDEVYRSLISLWARWQATYRRSAALAMDMAYANENLTRRVKQRVWDWSRSPDPLLQDSAARVYGMRMGEDSVEHALRELTRMGSRPELAASSSVAASMSMLFLWGADRKVMDQLSRWIASTNEHLPQHAVRILVILARQPGSADRQSWPALPEVAEHAAHWQEALVSLWRSALTNAETSRRAWNPMRKWLLAADNDEKLRALVESLTLRIFAWPLDQRALFNLRIWHNRDPGAVLIAVLLRRLETGSTEETKHAEA